MGHRRIKLLAMVTAAVIGSLAAGCAAGSTQSGDAAKQSEGSTEVAQEEADMVSTEGSTSASELGANKSEGSAVEDVVVYTEVKPYGQTPTKIQVKLNEDAGGAMRDLKPEDFTISGKSLYWMAKAPRDFTGTIAEVAANGDELTLTVGDFPEKYFYVQSYFVDCSSYPQLSFSSEQVSQVITPVADDFQHIAADAGDGFEYYLYENTDAGEALPIVVVFHGYGDTNSILTYRTSVAWAEPSFQEEHPCHVLSVVIGDGEYYMPNSRDKVFEAVHEKLNKMVEDGLVDPDRIYVMGNSFGGMSTIEFAEKYPDMPAALLALCAATNYSDTAVKNLEAIKDIPLYLAQAEHDGTIPVSCSQEVYDTLTELGSTKVQLKIFSDEEMNAAGCDPSNESTVSYHHVEMAVMEDPTYLNWAMDQTKGQ